MKNYSTILSEAAEIVLSAGKIDKYEYLKNEEILLFGWSIIIGQVKFTYSPLRKAFEKQIKTKKTSWSFKSFN